MTTLYCLQIEDSESDAELILRLLRKSGFDVSGERVETAEAFRAALPVRQWDIIIADYQLPSFDAPTALEIIREAGLDIPCIVVSGMMGEEIAVRMMKEGAADYITKNSLSRLPPAVERELREAEMRRERRRAVVELAEERERLLVTLRSIGEGVITADVRGLTTMVNPVGERLIGMSADEARGRPVADIFRLQMRGNDALCADPVKRVLASDDARELSRMALLIDAQGNELPITFTASPLLDANKQIVGAVLVFRDMTREQKIHEILQNADKIQSIGVLAGGIAHDFNNLLSGIFCNIEMAKLCCKNGDTTKAVERMGAALDVFSRAKDLTRQLLTFAKGGKPVQKTMSIEPILRRSSTFMLSGSNVSCDMHLQEGLWLCHIDENQIAQAVDNIILNARQAMPKGGQITITAENVPAGSPGLPGVDLGDSVRVSIRDTGPGIDPKARARIFDPFFTTKSAGSGLGLSIVFSIMKRHGGLVDLDSQPGEGTAFILYLPRAQAERKASGKRQAVVDMKSPLGHGRILVMDDEPFMRDICRELLEEGGFIVTCAANGDEAVDLFRSEHERGNPYLAVVLDLTVPGGKGGIEALAELRAIDPDICAIAASGYSNDPVMAQPAKYGFARCLPKPFKMEDLFAAIRHCAALRPS